MDLIYPLQNAYRHSVSLDGAWHFKFDQDGASWEKSVPKGMQVIVPSNVHDNFIDLHDRNYTGTMWFERHVYIQKEWLGELVYLHFENIGRRAVVYVNGTEVGRHEGAFVPASFEVTRHLHYGEDNTVIVKVNNDIAPYDMLGGTLVEGVDGQKQRVSAVPYRVPSGLCGTVHMTTAPQNRLLDVNFHIEELCADKAVISYVASIKGNCLVTTILRDRDGRVVATGVGGNGQLVLENPHLWSIGDGYMYRVDFDVSRLGKQHDTYSIPIGIRQVGLQDGVWNLNGKSIRLQGGKLDIVNIPGRLSNAVVARREVQRVLSFGGNCIYTGGYVLPELLLTMADEMGLLVLDELPAAGLGVTSIGELTNHISFYSRGDIRGRILPQHITMIRTLMQAHKNHPSIIGWSLIHEPGFVMQEDAPYFNEIVTIAGQLDPEHRPLMMTVRQSVHDMSIDVIKLFDVIIVSALSYDRDVHGVTNAYVGETRMGSIEPVRQWQAAHPSLSIMARISGDMPNAKASRGCQNYLDIDNMGDAEYYTMEQLTQLKTIAAVCGEGLDSVSNLHPSVLKQHWSK